MDKSVFKEIRTRDNISFRLYINLLNNSVEVVLLANEEAWKSTVTKESLQHLAKEHKITLEEYCQKLLESIKIDNSEIAFVFHNEEFIINKILRDSLMVKFFSCAVEKVNYAGNVVKIMDHLYFESLRASEQLHHLKTENEQLTKYKNQCELKLKELIAKKVTEENEQFGQFILVLNEKKRRIQHLTELLEAFRNGRPSVNPQVEVNKSKKIKKNNVKTLPVQKKETISESEDSDSDGSIVSNKTEEYAEPSLCLPSTSTETYDFLEDKPTSTHNLPKRIKIGKTQEDDRIFSAPKPPSPPKPKEQMPERNKSPDIDLSTQELLDMF